MDVAELRHTFVERIKELRAERGFNQGQFADFVGLSRGAMSYYEQEARTPDIGVLRLICEKCGMSADYMTGLIPDRDRAVANVCFEIGLAPKAVKKLQLIKQIQDIQSLDVFETIAKTFADPDEVMKLTPYTAVTTMVNSLLCLEGGMAILILLFALIFDGELYSNEAKVDSPVLRLPQDHSYLSVDYELKNLTAALWVNVQEEVTKIRNSLLESEAMKPYYDSKAGNNTADSVDNKPI